MNRPRKLVVVPFDKYQRLIESSSPTKDLKEGEDTVADIIHQDRAADVEKEQVKSTEKNEDQENDNVTSKADTKPTTLPDATISVKIASPPGVRRQRNLSTWHDDWIEL